MSLGPAQILGWEPWGLAEKNQPPLDQGVFAWGLPAPTGSWEPPGLVCE